MIPSINSKFHRNTYKLCEDHHKFDHETSSAQQSPSKVAQKSYSGETTQYISCIEVSTDSYKDILNGLDFPTLDLSV